MKKILIIVMLFILASMSFAYAEGVGENVKSVGWVLLEWALGILAPILTIVIIALAWKLLGKFGIQKNEAMEMMVNRYASQAIAFAAQKAKQHLKDKNEKMSSEDKYACAAKKLTEYLDSSGVSAKFKLKVEDYIESQLGYDTMREEKKGEG